MKFIKLLVTLLFITAMSYSQNTDDVVIAKRIKINSVVLGEEETIFVSTPKKDIASNKSYPVLYLLLGSEVSITYAAGLVKSLSDYEIVPEMIIVAIATNNRKRDCTPTIPKDIPAEILKNMQPGGADRFLGFIETELFPYIEKNYKTKPYRILAGHSDGGLCVTYAFVSHNNMFDSYIATSPTIGWDSNLVNRIAEDNIATMDLKRKQIFFSIAEKEDPRAIADVLAFARTLRLKAPLELKWKFGYVEHEDHFSQAANSLYNGLRFVYDDWKIDFDEMTARGLSHIKSHFQNLTEKYGYEVLPSENTLNMIGMEAFRRSRHDEALKILIYNTQLYPKFPEAYSCLGSIYLNMGNKKLAVQNFKRAVELATDLIDENLKRYKSQLENL